jgi:hypothetical protein
LTNSRDAQSPPPPPPILMKVKMLVEMHDKQLEMRRIKVTNFCEAEDKGLIQILITLDENSDALGFYLEDKQIIEDMLNLLPDKVTSLKSMAV